MKQIFLLFLLRLHIIASLLSLSFLLIVIKREEIKHIRKFSNIPFSRSRSIFQMASGEHEKHDHDSDDDNVGPHGYKAPQKMDLGSIVAKDAEDESLTRYKQLLLGNANNLNQPGSILIDPNDSRIVLPIRITLMFENHKPDVSLELKGPLEQLKTLHAKQTITIKEGETYRTQLEYYVQRDIVTGLKLKNKVLKARTIPIDKSKYMIGKFPFFFLPSFAQSINISGSRAPSNELQKYVSEIEQAPSGMLSRGSFLVKSLLTDDDKNIYAEWEWNLVIAKDWQ